MSSCFHRRYRWAHTEVSQYRDFGADVSGISTGLSGDSVRDTAFTDMTELIQMDIKNNVVNITTMNTDEPQIDFSSSIISFRIPRTSTHVMGHRDLCHGSVLGVRFLNFLSNISTAMDGASIEELLDVSENVIWSAGSDGGAYVADERRPARTEAHFHPGPQGFASVIGDAQRSVAAIRGLSHSDSSSGILPIPSALRSLLGSFGEGPHVNSILNRSLHDAAGYKFVLSDEGVCQPRRQKILHRGMQQRFVPDHESSVRGRR